MKPSLRRFGFCALALAVLGGCFSARGQGGAADLDTLVRRVEKGADTRADVMGRLGAPLEVFPSVDREVWTYREDRWNLLLLGPLFLTTDFRSISRRIAFDAKGVVEEVR